MTRRARVGTVAGGAVAALLAILVFTTWPRDILQGPLIVNDGASTADVIIVLGAGTRKGDKNNLPLQAEQRVTEGVKLFRAGVAPKLLVAGGLSPVTKLVEADLMAAYALQQGVDPKNIILERSSRDTWENAANSLAIMKLMAYKTAIVVTSPYHTRRACHFFRKQGASVHCVPAPYGLVPAHSIYDTFMDNRAVVREYGAWIYAWLQHRL